VTNRKRNRNNPPPPQANTSIATVTQSVSFTGPLPPPGLLARYNEVIPNGAERIMAMAERQSAHREALETAVVSGNVASQARGSHYAFIICLVTILGGFALIATGKSIYGISAVIASLEHLSRRYKVRTPHPRRVFVLRPGWDRSTARAELP